MLMSTDCIISICTIIVFTLSCYCARRKNDLVLKPGMFCRSRYTLLMSLCVAVGVELVVHIVAVAADLDQNMAVEITVVRIRAVEATVNVDRIGVVVVPNTVGSTLQISKTRWIFQVLISPIVPVLLDWLDDSVHVMYSVLFLAASQL